MPCRTHKGVWYLVFMSLYFVILFVFLIIGQLQGDLHIDNPLQNFIFKSITLKTIHGRRIFRDWEQSEMLLHEKL